VHLNPVLSIVVEVVGREMVNRVGAERTNGGIA
jgi:hypothetical protein